MNLFQRTWATGAMPLLSPYQRYAPHLERLAEGSGWQHTWGRPDGPSWHWRSHQPTGRPIVSNCSSLKQRNAREGSWRAELGAPILAGRGDGALKRRGWGGVCVGLATYSKNTDCVDGELVQVGVSHDGGFSVGDHSCIGRKWVDICLQLRGRVKNGKRRVGEVWEFYLAAAV